MDIGRPSLERWFNQYHPGVRFDLGGTMVPAADDRLAALFRASYFDTRYPGTEGDLEVRTLLAALERDERGGDGALEAGDIVLTCGATEANAAAIFAAVRPGAVVVLQDPLYYQFEPLVEAIGGRVRKWDPFGAGEAGDVAGGAGDVAGEDGAVAGEAPVDADTCLVVLNSPHNPTGRVVDVEAVARLAEALPACHVLVDEVYRGVSVMSPPPAAPASDRVIATNSFAKRWGMPGLRLGWLACRDAALRERALGWHEHVAHSPPRSSERVVAGMWQDLQRAVRENQTIAGRNRALFAGWLAQMRDLVDGTEPDTGVCTVLRPTWSGYDGDDRGLALRLRHEFDLFVLPGSCVGYPGWIRVGFGHREPADLIGTLARCEAGLRAVATGVAAAADAGGVDGHGPGEDGSGARWGRAAEEHDLF